VKTPLVIRVSGEVHDRLQTHAKKQHQPLSVLLERVLLNYLLREGAIPARLYQELIAHG
jgi:hypothetical protein